MESEWHTDVCYWTGVIALIAQVRDQIRLPPMWDLDYAQRKADERPGLADIRFQLLPSKYMRRVAASQNTVAVAGGSGAGWLLPLIEAFLRQGEHQAAVSATNPHRDGDEDLSRKAAMKVILATRDSLTRNWFEQAVMELVANKLSGRRCDELSVDIYYTGEKDHNSAIGGPSKSEEKSQVSNESVGSGTKALSTDVRRSEEAASNIIQSALTPKYVSQRPDLPAIIADAADYGSESTSVLVCGPLSMQSDVSNAVARAQIGGMKDGKRDVYLHMEHFSWA
ncbi:hypothetical protein J4E80_001568 [Alternaria sp. BMP 0032]|nr:hypothetical protein J4E80_001568 [Alternaria sp. BMP 0032]